MGGTGGELTGLDIRRINWVVNTQKNWLFEFHINSSLENELIFFR